MRQSASRVGCLVGGRLCGRSSARLPRDDPGSKSMLRISSCDADQACRWHQGLRPPAGTMGRDTRSGLGRFPKPVFGHNCFLRFFPSLIGSMTYRLNHTSDPCGLPPCSPWSFYQIGMETLWKSFWKYYFEIGSLFQYIWRLWIMKNNDQNINLKIIY